MVNVKDRDMNLANSKIYIANCVNKDNIELATNSFNSCTLYIDKKFALPMSSDISIGDSKTIENIVSNVESEYGRKLNDTQLKNLITKIKFWCIDIFSNIIEAIDNEQSNLLVFIDNNVSKHEWIMISQLFKLGVSFFIISENTAFESGAFNNREKIEQLDDSTVLNYKTNGKVEKKISELKHIDEIEEAIYTNTSLVCCVIKGIDELENTSDFYGKLHKCCKTNNNFKLFTQTLGPVAYEDSSNIPRIKNIDANYVLSTAPMFLKWDNKYKSVLSKAFQDRMHKLVGKVSLQQLNNKAIHTICKLNEIGRYADLTHIIFYGEPNEVDTIILDVLSSINKYNIIVLVSDKEKALDFVNIQIVELPNSTKYFEMPTIDRRNTVRTVAATVEHRINSELFNGDTIGMYKPGQIIQCDSKRFTTTFDEIKLWWDKDMYMRPGFESNESYASIPNMFKIIAGVKNCTDTPNCDPIQRYVEYISGLITDKTFLFRRISTFNKTVISMINTPVGMKILRASDVNKTRFEAQVPFYENGRLNRNRIKSGINYRYGFLSADKQELILDNIEKIINNQYIDYSSYNLSKSMFIDSVLGTLLNIHIDILRALQWFSYYGQSPKVILVIENEEQMIIEALILLTFLSLIGFDILLFVPTCYNTIETHILSDFIYDKHTIGESIINVPVDAITKLTATLANKNVQQSNKSKGFLGKLFN